MCSALPSPPTQMDSVVINDFSSQKSTVTLLNSPHHQHHLYNYWTLNDRLRAKNEKLFRRQQSSCRLAFYSLWLFIFAAVMTILVYRFTDDCPLTKFVYDRKTSIVRCSRHWLFFAAISICFLACTGLIFGACRYFRSQPQPYIYNDRQELHITSNYDLLPPITSTHSCCCHTQLSDGASILTPPYQTNPLEENSNITVTSSIPTISPHRKVPPFTYEELPPTKIISRLSTLPILTSNPNPNKSAFFSSSTSSSASSPQSMLHQTPKTTTLTNHHQRKSTLTFEDPCPSTPTSYTTCVCAVDVWERQARPSIGLSLR